MYIHAHRILIKIILRNGLNYIINNLKIIIWYLIYKLIQFNIFYLTKFLYKYIAFKYMILYPLKIKYYIHDFVHEHIMIELSSFAKQRT